LSMILGKVISRVVSSAKLENIPARQMLTVQVLDGFGDTKNPLIALDSVQAGPGDLVLVMQEGTGAREALGLRSDEALPAQAVIVGVVDQIERS